MSYMIFPPSYRKDPPEPPEGWGDGPDCVGGDEKREFKDWLLGFEEYDVDNCLVCKATMSPDPPYMGQVVNNRWVANFTSCYPFCHALCAVEAFDNGYQPCDVCSGTGFYRFRYWAGGDYESDSVECPCCPESRGFFKPDERVKTLRDAEDEERDRARDEMYP